MIDDVEKFGPIDMILGNLDDLREIDADREAQAELTDVIKWTGLAKTEWIKAIHGTPTMLTERSPSLTLQR